jgi:hypothetical protein
MVVLRRCRIGLVDGVKQQPYKQKQQQQHC